MEPSRARSYSEPLELPSRLKDGPSFQKTNTQPGSPTLKRREVLDWETTYSKMNTVLLSGLESSTTSLAGSTGLSALTASLSAKLDTLLPMEEKVLDLMQEPTDLQNVRELLCFSTETVVKVNLLFKGVFSRIKILQANQDTARVHSLFLFCLSWLNQNRHTPSFEEAERPILEICKLDPTFGLTLSKLMENLPFPKPSEPPLYPQGAVNFESAVLATLSEENLKERAGSLANDIHRFHRILYCQLVPDHMVSKGGKYGISKSIYDSFHHNLIHYIEECLHKEIPNITKFFYEVALSLMDLADYAAAKTVAVSFRKDGKMKKLFKAGGLDLEIAEFKAFKKLYIPIFETNELVFLYEEDELFVKMEQLKFLHTCTRNFLSPQVQWRQSLEQNTVFSTDFIQRISPRNY